MKIHADPITVNCRKVLAGLQLIGAPYELVHVDYFKGEQKGAEYAAINPNASVPAMVDGDFVLWESNAILQYAAEKSGNAAVYPSSLQARADVNRWLLWESSSWFPCCYVYLVENCVKPLLGALPTPRCSRRNNRSFTSLQASLMRGLLARAGFAAIIQRSRMWRWPRRCTCTAGRGCLWANTLIWLDG